MSTSLLTTKLYIPPVRPELVPRPRLIERLDDGLHRKLTLISAPAGFGKTTLLGEWISHFGNVQDVPGRSGRQPVCAQRAIAERREQATQAMLQRLKGLRLKLFRKLVTWAQKCAPLREDGIADLGLGYPLLRRMLLELGRRFVQAGAIERADDIFWLFQAEAEQAAAALDQGQPVECLAERIPQRKTVWRAEKRLTPPTMLPPRTRWLGIRLEGMLPAHAGDQAGDTIKGTGTSPGRVTAPARVLHGSEDFDQMKPGEVLVAAITTPAWTPLFAMASAVVTDVGGPLSHGSIVAREYGIPAVLGTGVANRRIQSGQLITVDGGRGLVEILETA